MVLRYLGTPLPDARVSRLNKQPVQSYAPCKYPSDMACSRALSVLFVCGAVSYGSGLSTGQSCFGVPAPQKLPLGARRHLGAPLVLPRRPTAARLGRRLAFHDAFDQQSDDLRTLCGLAPEDRFTKRAAAAPECAPPRSRSLTVLASRSVQARWWARACSHLPPRHGRACAAGRAVGI